MSDLIAGRQWGQKCVKRKQKRFLEHGDDQIPGNGYSETLCHLLLPLLLSDLPKQRQHPLEKEDKKKDILIRKLPHSVAPAAPST